MKIYAIRVFVDDLARARAFYGGTLGLREEWAMDVAAGYDLGVSLIVEQDDPDERGEEPSAVGRFVGVSIQVEDIQKAYEDLTARGVAFTGPPEKMFWGGTLAHFRDPSGNTLTLLG